MLWVTNTCFILYWNQPQCFILTEDLNERLGYAPSLMTNNYSLLSFCERVWKTLHTELVMHLKEFPGDQLP